MGKKRSRAWSILKFVLGALASVVVLFVPLSFIGSNIWIMLNEKRLNDSVVYTRIARHIGALSLMDPQPEYIAYSADPWFLMELRELGAQKVYFRGDEVHVRFGGGFHDYGYKMILDSNASTSTSRTWDLYFYSEGSPLKELGPIQVLDTEGADAEAFFEEILAEYDQRLLENPRSLYYHSSKIKFLLESGCRSAAMEALDGAIGERPEWLWPRAAKCSLNGWENEACLDEIRSWVEENPGFRSYIYLNWLYRKIGQPRMAAEALENAVDYPLWPRGERVTEERYSVDVVSSEIEALIDAHRSGYPEAAKKAVQHLINAQDEFDIYATSDQETRNVLRALMISPDVERLDTNVIDAFEGTPGNWDPFFEWDSSKVGTDECEFDTSVDSPGIAVE